MPEVPEMIMPWGKYQGVDIEELPSGYLKWLAENCDDNALCEAADKEYRYRDDHSRHFE